MKGLEKLLPEHKERLAFVYPRQSTMAQVLEHRSSTERQLGLEKLAVDLGWPSSQVEVLADDLGVSGKFSENRAGFQRLASQVSLGRVGAVFSTEVSRLARSSADWHRLLEIAGLTKTLIIDEQAVYEPRDPNDRLVLGMKGTMAEFELVWLRQRMNEGKRHLARQGRLWLKPPVGYVYEGEKLVMDPDEEVRRAVGRVFERYRACGTCLEVVRDFREQGIRFPTRVGSRVEWGWLSRERVRRLLTNPRYAGAFVHGRSQTETVLEEGQRRQRCRKVAMPDWPVVLHGAHPRYLSWEEFMANQKRLSENGPSRKEAPTRGAPSRGAALLQGMLVCGRCGSRVTVSYGGTGGRCPIYVCRRMTHEGLGKECLTVSRRVIEEPVVEVVLRALTREELTAATEVVQIIEQEEAALERQWSLRLERARYEAKRAERQYDACEPENRVVVRTLETRWNEALVELQKLEREYEEGRRRRRTELTEIDRQRIAELSSDVRKLWGLATTTDRDRKMLLRLLLKDVSVVPIEVPRRALRLKLLWHTHAVCELEVERPRSRWDRKSRWRMVTSPSATTSQASA